MASPLGRLGVAIIQLFLRVFGRTVHRADAPWLEGPIGAGDPIGDRPYAMLAEREGLTVHSGEGGLIPDFNVLAGPSFDPARVDPRVRAFYERTSAYDLDVWSESRFPGRLFLWLLVTTVSRYMNQLNFPVFGLEVSRGMSSEVITLRDAEGRAAHTGWLRKLLESGRVIYTGFYTTVTAPRDASRCVKVVFPLPRGNATVILRPGYDEQGRFTLDSRGAGFGDAGFYRIFEADPATLKVRRFESLRERFCVYTDDRGELRCDHGVRFLGFTILRLHYRIRAAGARA